MENKRLFDALERSNPWWKGNFELDYKPRNIYEEIKKFTKSKQIISLTGLRRTGKTTILFKIVKDSIKEYRKENIIYFSFDDFREIRLLDVIDAYFELIKRDNDKSYLFLFDEVQKVIGWEEQLKRIYDENKKFKIVISGSESLFIKKGTRESLAGRMFEFQIKTLSFKEFLNFKGKNFNNLLLYKKEILSEFKNFLYCNGFPEIINENQDFIRKYVKENVVEKIIYRDIPQIVRIENTETKPLNLFINKFKLKSGIILTYDKEETIGNIKVIPFYKYLLTEVSA